MDMFIEIKFPVNTHTQNVYFLYKRDIYTPNETWTFVLLRLPGNIIPCNLSAFAFIELSANNFAITWVSFSSMVLSTLMFFMGDADTIIIGVIIQIAFGYEIEYIVEKNVKNQGT